MKKKLTGFMLCAVLVIAAAAAVYAATTGFTLTYLPGTADTVTDLPDPASLIPEEKEEYEYGQGKWPVAQPVDYTVSPQTPQRDGYEFIDWTLDYDALFYKVTYVINPDPVFCVPEWSAVPVDDHLYAPNEYVDVADQLTMPSDVEVLGYITREHSNIYGEKYTVDYPITSFTNENGQTFTGCWEFVTWDKDDFLITENTTITGGWVFTPVDLTPKYHYVVHYRLYSVSEDGTIDTSTPVADDLRVEIKEDELGKPATAYALPLKKLYKKYSNPSLYRIKPDYDSVTKIIEKDGDEIYIYYEKIPK